MNNSLNAAREKCREYCRVEKSSGFLIRHFKVQVSFLLNGLNQVV